MHQDMARCVEVILRRDEAAAERIVRLDGMTALLDTRTPDVWDANWLRVERPGLPIEQILAAGDETIGEAGMGHRTLWADDQEEGERLAAELQPQGWKLERGVWMTLRRPPDREPDAGIEVEEVRLDDVEESRREFLREDLAEYFDPVTDAILDQHLIADRTWGEVSGDRWFAVREDGRVVSFCRLFSDDGVGQVEEVATLSHARNRGLARSVVLAAVEASKAEGHELTFLGALADDWPRKLYARLGFEEIGSETVLYLRPDPTA